MLTTILFGALVARCHGPALCSGDMSARVCSILRALVNMHDHPLGALVRPSLRGSGQWSHHGPALCSGDVNHRHPFGALADHPFGALVSVSHHGPALCSGDVAHRHPFGALADHPFGALVSVSIMVRLCALAMGTPPSFRGSSGPSFRGSGQCVASWSGFVLWRCWHTAILSGLWWTIPEGSGRLRLVMVRLCALATRRMLDKG